MLKKSLQHFHKLGAVCCCIRETMSCMQTNDHDVIKFEVNTEDVKKSWLILERSIKTFTLFNVIHIIVVKDFDLFCCSLK